MNKYPDNIREETLTMAAHIEGTLEGKLVLILSIIFFFWAINVTAYRLFLGPLGVFRGPKIAALTGWYEIYFDCFKRVKKLGLN